MWWFGIILVVGIAWWFFSNRKSDHGATQQPPRPQASDGLTVTVTFEGPDREPPPAPEPLVQELLAKYAYVKSTQVEVVKGAARWFDEVTQKRRVKDGSPKAALWVTPFLSPGHAGLPDIQESVAWGPGAATTLQKVFRARIRDARKTGQLCDDLLRSLYGASVLAFLNRELAFCGRSVRDFVALADLAQFKFDYGTTGYQGLDTLGKTDIKWLVEVFGEPKSHVPAAQLVAPVVQKAVTRYCQEDAKTSESLDAWLDRTVRIHLKYSYESPEQAVERQNRRRAPAAGAAQDSREAWAATQGEFVVADLETTGLDATTEEILEIAAVLTGPDGRATNEFTLLVRPSKPVPELITQLTGITQAEVDKSGVSLSQALAAFKAFVGTRPIFFHNASFDQGFLNPAAVATGITLTNPVFDTLPLAREAWPNLKTHKLEALAKHVKAQVRPSHRALGDAKATLAVLVAARIEVGYRKEVSPE